MERIIKYLCCLLAATLALVACDKEDLGASDIRVPAFDYDALSQTDKYIYDNYTVPYNIDVVYRWNQGDMSSDDMRRNLVPPREEQVEPFLQMIKTVWVDTYASEVGAQTLRAYVPKVLLLTGSASYNDDGSTTEGTAEGGRQIVLYSVNDFNFQLDQIMSYAHVMHHEFAHILHQTVEYDPEFENITPAYSSSWMQMNDQTARSKGLKESRVIIRHALKNSFIPILTQMGTSFGGLLGGAMVTEQVFAINGIGSYLINAINQRNYSAVQSTVLVIAFMFVVVNLVVDLLYGAIDPRIRYE